MNTRKQHGYTADDLVAILDTVIPIYSSSNIISFHTILENHCTYRQTHWDYWLHDRTEKDERILERFNILRDIQEQKIINGAMSGDLNPAFSMFFLKCKRKWVEQQHVDRIELDKKRLDQDKEIASINADILIGFKSETNDQ